MLRKTFLLLLTAGFSQASDRNDDGCRWGFGGYGEPCGGLYVGADDKAWLDAVENSNSTGTYTMPGYDVSMPWPGAPMEGWTISKTAVDLSNLPRNSEPESRMTAVVAADLKIIAPESLYVPSKDESDHGKPVVNVHPDWVFCAWRWYDPPADNRLLGTYNGSLAVPEDGSCTKWLSEECVKAVEKQATTAYAVHSDTEGMYGVRHTCAGINTPDECQGTRVDYAGSFLSTFGLPLQYLNGSTTFLGGYVLEEETTVQDTQEMWTTITETYQSVLTLFGRASNNSDGRVEPGFSKLSCVRALPAEGKSNSSDGNDTNGAPLLSSDFAVNLAFFACLLFWLFL
ncbi:hypothetical protein CPLU01_03723 [Colletotrichum plurivorum]|uniref:Uncharacterized protein n=1 Tax=Colletotrichum plurivorum TaxID=2175906 RepID=A0A8H6KRM0_9PEZI|nr:hypothetical protein CPLU01_03723 [Colletotrichum plurivorum]